MFIFVCSSTDFNKFRSAELSGALSFFIWCLDEFVLQTEKITVNIIVSRATFVLCLLFSSVGNRWKSFKNSKVSCQFVSPFRCFWC